MQNVTVNVFPGGFNWPLYVARDNGLFAAENLHIAIRDTPNSVAQMTALAAGDCDIVMTAVDNIVAYVEGQGEAPIGAQPEFFAFMGSDTGFLHLVARPGIESVAALRGKTVSVDALTTGYAFVLFEMLRRHGLARGDCNIVRAGGMVQRWEGLRAGQHDATLLSGPYNLLARQAGFTELARATAVIGPYQGNVGAARRSWAAANRDTVIGFIRGYAAAIEWLYERGNRDAALGILRRNLPPVTAELAALSYAELLHPQHGFFRRGRIDAAGLRTVLDLRRRYAEPARALPTPGKYVDETFLRAALG